MNNTTSSPPQLDSRTPDAHDRNGDNLLKAIVLAAHLGHRIPVTLTVGGTLVTGTIIEGGRYIDQLLDAAVHPTDRSAEDIREALGGFREAYRQGQVFEAGRLGLIHLEGAKFFSPGAAQPSLVDGEGVLWRGRLDQVSGFSVITP